jgi:hypothetical protein
MSGCPHPTLCSTHHTGKFCSVSDAFCDDKCQSVSVYDAVLQRKDRSTYVDTYAAHVPKHGVVVVVIECVQQ